MPKTVHMLAKRKGAIVSWCNREHPSNNYPVGYTREGLNALNDHEVIPLQNHAIYPTCAGCLRSLDKEKNLAQLVEARKIRVEKRNERERNGTAKKKEAPTATPKNGAGILVPYEFFARWTSEQGRLVHELGELIEALRAFVK